MFLLASVSNIFRPAPANFLVTAPAFPLRTSPCPYCQHGWFNGTTWVVMGPGPSSCFLTIEIALRMDTHIIQSEVSQKEKHQYSILTHIYGIEKDGNNDPICKTARDTDVKNSLLDSMGEGKGGMI